LYPQSALKFIIIIIIIIIIILLKSDFRRLQHKLDEFL